MDNEDLIIFDAIGQTLAVIPLPDALKGAGGTLIDGGAVPSAHVAANGVGIVGALACYYAMISANAVPNMSGGHAVCYHVREQRWHSIPLTAIHNGGAIMALGEHLIIGGGFDPNSATATPTATVDTIKFTSI